MNSTGCDTTLLLIRGFDIFEHITDQEYEELGLVHNFIEAPKDDYIYFPHQNHNKLYFTKKGFIKIGYIDEEGREVIKEIIQRGEVFGQFTLEKNNDRDEFAKAYKSDVSLCAFTIEDFKKLLAKKPEMAIRYSTLLGNKLMKVETRLINLLNRDVKTRLLQLLLQLTGESSSHAENNTLSFERYLTHDDIARLIGSSRQTVTTFLNQLEAADLIKTGKKEITLMDVPALKKLCHVI
jgi:CRP/FNR family transcriptional regulator